MTDLDNLAEQAQLSMSLRLDRYESPEAQQADRERLDELQADGLVYQLDDAV